MHQCTEVLYLLRWRGALRIFMDPSPASVTTCCVIQEQRRVKQKTPSANKLEWDTNHSDTQAFQQHVPELEFKGR